MTLPRLKHAIKVVVAHVLYGLGLLQFLQRLLLRRRAVVLMYHRVLDATERRTTASHPAMVVSSDTFDRHLRLLGRRFTPLTLDEFAAHLRQRRPFPDSSCMITFDDGWRDNLLNAMPMLRAQGLPATIFLPVNFVGTRRLFAREAFTHLVLRAREGAVTSPAEAGRVRALLDAAGLVRLLDLTSPDPRSAVIEAIGAAPVTASIEALAADLAQAMGVRVEELATPDTFMTWAEIETLAREGVAFGGHGANHRRLALLPADERDADIRASWDVLAARVSPETWAFAYPNGSCNAATAAAVAAAGYEVAFTTASGPVTCGDNPLFVKRINIHEEMTASAPMFLARLVGLF